MEKITAIVGLLIALSVASERLVEIVKGLIPPLSGKFKDPRTEGWRCAANQLLAVAAGVLTAFLAAPAIPSEVLPQSATGSWTILALGLLASGGSGLWNAVLSYVLLLKDDKAAGVKKAREAVLLPVTRTRDT